MPYDPSKHHRRSIRLRGYDYAGGGAYYLTICTQGKESLFGEIIEGEMVLNEAGRLVEKIWDGLPQRFVTLVLDAFQIMPNHLHAVFVLPGPGLEPALAKATGAPIIQPSGRGRACPTLFEACPTLFDQIKPGAGTASRNQPTEKGTASRNQRTEKGTASRPPTGMGINVEGTASRPPTSMGEVVGAFKSISTIAVNKLTSRTGSRLLQENFYEHIIRDVGELETIREYIIHNPQRWLEDPENPNRL